MIQSIEIKDFRGIREGKLEDLSPLTVLVGPNGCGKSTILDALLIAASPNCAARVEEVAQRHARLALAQRWFVWRGTEGKEAVVRVQTAHGQSRAVGLHAKNGGSLTVRDLGVQGPAGETKANRRGSAGGGMFGGGESKNWLPEIRLINTGVRGGKVHLHKLFTAAVVELRRDEAIGIFKDAITDVRSVEILTDEEGNPVVHANYDDRSVPVELCGDGAYALLRICLEIASSPGGVVLLEEPEVHQHPGAIYRSALAIRAAARRKIQIVLTTHSLELIDYLLSDATDADLNKLSVFRLNLKEGTLVSHRLSGPDVVRARHEIEDDLR